MDTLHSRSGVPVQVLDLQFLDGAERIASWLIQHEHGNLVIETGPGTVTEGMAAALARHGLRPEDITEVLVSHIHLDHAGASGWFAQHGATIHVHPKGAPHLLDPSALMKSAGRIYGDDMDRLWGECIPVPEAQIVRVEDGQKLSFGNVVLEAMDTPGHADHHIAWFLEDLCFTGDVGGVRMPGSDVVVPPMPPPEFRPEQWFQSLERIEAVRPSCLCPTHFGVYTDVAAHLDRLREGLRAAVAWADEVMPEDLAVDDLKARYTAWLRDYTARQGLGDGLWENHEAINPSWMSALGLRRYWRKAQEAS